MIPQFFFERLRHERELRGLTQDAMAQSVGVSKRSYCAYESGETAPSAKLLAALATMGVDVAYLLTGQRHQQQSKLVVAPATGVVLSAEEKRVIEDYRNAPDTVRKGIRTTLSAFAPASGSRWSGTQKHAG